MGSYQNFSHLFSVTMALCLTLSVAFPRALDNWESQDIQGPPRFAPLINSLFTSLIRSQIRHRGQLRVSRASSLLKRIGRFDKKVYCRMFLLYQYGTIRGGTCFILSNQHRKCFMPPSILLLGIAGLDNMDAITTTLDRARNRTGPQRMSVRLSMADLRRVMATGR